MSNNSEISRSWLLVNGLREELFDGAAKSRADEVILDVEDAVDPKYKAEALQKVIGWLNKGNRAWVRINDYTTPFWREDLYGLKGVAGVKGVMLAKTETASQITETYAALGSTLPVIALVESALGIEDARDIASAKGAFRLAFGSGDYRRDTGASADDLAMAYPRSKLVVASRIGNLPGPIDGPTVGSNHGVLKEKSELAVNLGMTGKLCLDIDQLTVINEIICPTVADVTWAHDFITDFEARDRVIRDGSDLPRLGRAEKIMKLANAFEILPR